jgi:hypothetical protein
MPILQVSLHIIPCQILVLADHPRVPGKVEKLKNNSITKIIYIRLYFSKRVSLLLECCILTFAELYLMQMKEMPFGNCEKTSVSKGHNTGLFAWKKYAEQETSKLLKDNKIHMCNKY